jgi:hypothetical protein
MTSSTRDVRNDEKTAPLTLHLAASHGATIVSADDVAPGDIPQHSEEAPSMTSRMATSHGTT